MFTNVTLWSLFLLHSVCLTMHAGIRWLHGVALVKFQISIIYLQQVTVYHGLDTLEKAGQHHCVSRVGYIGKSRSTCNFHACLEAIMDPLIGDQGEKLYMPMFVLGIRLHCVIVFSQWHM